jgi:hypothetical protein
MYHQSKENTKLIKDILEKYFKVMHRDETSSLLNYSTFLPELKIDIIMMSLCGIHTRFMDL